MTLETFVKATAEQSGHDVRETRAIVQAMFTVLAGLPTDEALRLIADGLKTALREEGR